MMRTQTLLLLALGLFASTAFGQINNAGLDKAATKLIKDTAFRWAQTLGKGDFEETVKACDYPFYFDGGVLQTADAVKQRFVEAKEKIEQKTYFHEELTVLVDTQDVIRKVEGFSWENIVVVAVRAQRKIENVETILVLVRVEPKNQMPFRIVGFKD